MPDAPQAPLLERWCFGCRLTGTRSLTDPEREGLVRRRRRHRRRALLAAGILPAASVLIALAAAVPGFSDDTRVAVGASLMVLAYLLGLPVSIILIRDHLALASRLSKDLAEGEVWMFTPPIDGTERGEAPVAGEGESMSSTIELLPHARQLVNPGDDAPRLGIELVREAAPDPGIGLRAPLALEMSPASPGVRLEQRALGAAERDEIERAARRLLVPGFGTWLAAPAFVFVAWTAATGSAQRTSPIGLVNAALAITLCGFVLVRYGRGVALSRRLRHDLELGLVVHTESGADEGDTEFLPASRLLWRVAGVPALWRDDSRGVCLLRASL